MDHRTISRKTRVIGAQDGIDQGLRAYMISVFNYMAIGLGITGLTAFAFASSPELMAAIWGSPLKWVVMLAPLGMVFFISFKINTLQASTAQGLFLVYSLLMGLSLSYIFIVFTGQSVARVFFITSALFASMSLFGYTTNRDLTAMGSFMMMGVIGIIIASLVNMFFKSSAMQFMISVIGVIVFTGLTAYDVQAIKSVYYESDDSETISKKAVIGALRLYLDFINLFISLLQILGDRR